jgi:beta-glucosidase
MPRSTAGAPITPDALYWAAKFFYERYRLPVLITENGMTNVDFVMSDGKVHDPQRIEFMKGYLGGLKRAAGEGIPVIGYMHWSILDNYEWAEGYDKRFGLVYVDYRTQKRTIKDSGFFYKEVIETNGECL